MPEFLWTVNWLEQQQHPPQAIYFTAHAKSYTHNCFQLYVFTSVCAGCLHCLVLTSYMDTYLQDITLSIESKLYV